MSTWVKVYESTDQTIEQRIVGEGENAVVEERVTWHRQTPEKQIADLEATVAALTEQATGKITKAQLTARLDAAKPVKPGKGDEIQAAREAVE